MCADQVEGALFQDDVTFLDLRPAGANGLDFPAVEHDAGLIPLFNEVIKKRFFVFDDAHGANSNPRREFDPSARIGVVAVSPATMPHVEKSALVPYSAADMFALVDAVERYAEFLPWCGGTEQVNHSETVKLATIHIDYRGIRQSFTTENTRVGCEQMQMKLRDGPFSQLDGVWRFQALGEAACKVSLALDYGFSNALLEKAVGPVFGMIASTMIERFVARADAIYGQSR